MVATCVQVNEAVEATRQNAQAVADKAGESGANIGAAAKDTAVGLSDAAKEHGGKAVDDIKPAQEPAKNAATELFQGLKVCAASIRHRPGSEPPGSTRACYAPDSGHETCEPEHYMRLNRSSGKDFPGCPGANLLE